VQSCTVNEHVSSVKAATRAAPISVDPEGSAAQRGLLSAVARDLASGVSGPSAAGLSRAAGTFRRIISLVVVML
jgi:hypothetical protein